MKTLELEVGRLICGQVRDYLKRMKFEGYQIDFWESSGVLSRDFLVRGDDAAISHFSQVMEDYRQRAAKAPS